MMRHEKRIIDAFKSNCINKILLIDDAYDPPALEDTIGQLADFFEKEDGRAACVKCDIQEDTLKAAIQAAEESNTDSEELEVVYQALYQKFARTGKEEFDPGSFRLNKEPSLAGLRPLQALLRKCGNKVKVHTAGLGNGQECYDNFRPEVLFLDYYLDRSDGLVEGNTSKQRENKARRESLNLLKDIVKTADEEGIAAIVLMSSQEINDVEQYRRQAQTKDGQIIALRFQFLNKKMIRQNGRSIDIDHDAADALLDTSQGYLFGKFLQQALNQWKYGAQRALESFMRQIGNLHMKDFAYLLRFRLREESQPLSEYLEWLFGEYLKGLIEHEVDWKHASFSRLDNENPGEKIEGAFEGPTVNIAKIFHSVRVNHHRVAARRGYQLGDLYAQTSGDGISIRVVITPDCDLAVRKGRMKAKSVLTMAGTLNNFNQSDSVADDFFLHKETPYSVRWHPKDLQTFPIEGQNSLHGAAVFEFLGTLRPLYAQEMQRRVLTDLSRVGLPVAPALGLNAVATAWLRTNHPDNPFKPISIKPPTFATIIPSRAGKKDTEGHRVLLSRHFVNDLIDQLKDEIKFGNVGCMHPVDVERLNEAMKNDGTRLYDAFLGEGGLTKAKGKFGTGFVLGNNPDKGQPAPWLQIVLQISEEAMEELRMIDPLDMPSDKDLK